jgi:hypothetical protein
LRPFLLLIISTIALPFALWLVLQILQQAKPGWLPEGWEEAVAWQVLIAVSGLTFVLLFSLTSLAKHLILIPSRLEIEAKKKADERYELVSGKLAVTSVENERLNEERVPGMTAASRTGLHSLGIGAHLMWAELEVYNTSPTLPLADVRVRVVDSECIFQDQDNPDLYKNLGHELNDWSPITLRWAQSDYITAIISGGASRTLLVAFSDDSNGPPAVFNDLDHTRCSLESKITLEISSPNSATLHSSYFIQCHGNYVGGPSARFEFVPWEGWVSIRTDVDLDNVPSEADEVDYQNEND